MADLELARDELERQDIAAVALGRASRTPGGCDCTGGFELSRAPPAGGPAIGVVTASVQVRVASAVPGIDSTCDFLRGG